MGLDEGLIEAARKGNIEKVRKLLKEGVDLNVKDENGKTLLHARAIVREAYKLIKEEYLSRLGSVSEYFDEKERIFLDFIRSNSEYHRENLEKVLSWSKISER